ncbi:MAG: hypothetical protein Q4A59_05110, partial [Erysipelotrichaceae bacterium]|nr:hypothetical protein [Erysipelotrichaceae bacterium]
TIFHSVLANCREAAWYKNATFKPYFGGNNMSIKTLSCAALSLFLLCGCSSSNKDEDTMISLADYNSHYSEVLNSSEN